MSKQRLDILLVSRNLVESRELAQRLIIAGEVSVGGHPSTKPGLKVNEDADIAIRNRPRYVSRGGLKMEGALNAFPVSAEGKVCLDIGASTGGFTDCLLQHGAARVHAIDVGTNQLVWKLRQDPRVIVKEKFNARYMTPEDMKKAVEITAGKAKTECSGNVTRENIENLKKIGVDYISCGALTHSAPILDVSLKNFFPYPL